MTLLDSEVRARIDTQTKDAASRVLKAMGLNVSDAIRLMLIRVASDQTLPFAIKVPNAETLAAMSEAERGDVKRYATAEAMMAAIDADP